MEGYQFLYKGFLAVDNMRNKNTAVSKMKDDYLMRKTGDDLGGGTNRSNLNNKDQLYNYQINIPKPAELNSIKILNDPNNLYKFLLSDDDTFFTSETFQRKYMRELPKLLWQTEKMEDLGDFVLLFPNPDKKKANHLPRHVENGLLLKQAEAMFKDIFETNYNYPFKRKFMTALTWAFQNAFVELEEYEPPTDSEKKRILEEQNERIKEKLEAEEKKRQHLKDKIEEEKRKKAGGADPNHPGLELTEVKGTSKKKKKQAKKDKAATERDGEDKSEEAPLKTQPGLVVNNEESGENEQTPDQIKPLLVHTPNDPPPEANDPSPAKSKKDALAEDEEQCAREKLKYRRIWGGGLYIEPLASTTERQATHFHWEKNPHICSTPDFLTLLRKTVEAVLANHGFLSREIFVNDGTQIALVLTLPETNMHNIAEQMKLSKSVEFGVADLMSLEPVDSKNRPLRTNSYLMDEQLWERAYTVTGMTVYQIEQINSLRREIKGLLETDCNFKRIIRMCEGTWTEEKLDFVNGIFDHARLDLMTWQDYLNYLRTLAMHVRNIMLLKSKIMYVEEEFYGTTRMAAAGNKNRKITDGIEVVRLVNRLVVRAFIETGKEFPRLPSIWEKMKTAPPAYAYEYETATSHMRPRNRKFYDLVWMDYFFHYPSDKATMHKLLKRETQNEITDKKKESMSAQNTVIDHAPNAEDQDVVIYSYKFNKVERLKIVHYLVSNIIDIESLKDVFEGFEKLIQNKFVRLVETSLLNNYSNIFFPLHNRSITGHKNYRKMFAPLTFFKKIYNTLASDVIKIQVQIEEAGTGESNQPDKTKKRSKSDKRRISTNQPLSAFSDTLNRNGHSIHDMSIQGRERQHRSHSSNRERVHSARGPNASSEASHHLRGSSRNINSSPTNEERAKVSAAKNKNLRLVLAYLEVNFGYLNGYLGGLETAILQEKKDQNRRKRLVEEIERLRAGSSTIRIGDPIPEVAEAELSALPNAMGGFEDQNGKTEQDPNKEDEEEEKMKKHHERSLMRSGTARILEEVSLIKLEDSYTDLLKMRKLKDFYSVCNENMIIAINGALNSNTSIRDAMASSFTHLTVFDIKNFVESSLSYPIEKAFTNSIFRNVKNYPESTVRSYFGEKVALYFAFINFYRDRMINITLLGIMVAFAQIFYYGMRSVWGENSEDLSSLRKLKYIERAYEWSTIFLGVVIVIWGRRFHLMWENYEKEFAVRYGMEAVEETKAIRSNFRGIYKRSLVDDSMNSTEEVTSQVLLRKNAQSLFLILYCILTFISSYIILEYKRLAFEEKWIVGTSIPNPENDTTFIDFNEILFNVFEFIRIMIFQGIFYSLIKKFIRWQNRKYEEDIEESLTVNAGLYQLFNNGVVIVITALQSLTAKTTTIEDTNNPGEIIEYTENVCTRKDCPQEIAMFFIIYCILLTLYIIVKKIIIATFIARILKYVKRKVKERKDEFEAVEEGVVLQNSATPSQIQQQLQAKSVHSGQKSQNIQPDPEAGVPSERLHANSKDLHGIDHFGLQNLINETTGTPKVKQQAQVDKVVRIFYNNPAEMYELIDHEINHQISELQDYGGDEFGSSVDNYLSLFNSYCTSVMFGISLPISFLVCWVTSYLENYVDRYSILKETRRERPMSAKSIGVWLELLSLVNLLSIWSNSFFIAFLLYGDKSTIIKMSSFLGLSIGLTIVVNLYSQMAQGVSYGVSTIKKRSEFVKAFLFTKEKPTSREKVKNAVDTAFKVFGDVDFKKKVGNLLDLGNDLNKENEEKIAMNKEVALARIVASKNMANSSIELAQKDVKHNEDLDGTVFKAENPEELRLESQNISRNRANMYNSEVLDQKLDPR